MEKRFRSQVGEEQTTDKTTDHGLQTTDLRGKQPRRKPQRYKEASPVGSLSRAHGSAMPFLVRGP